MRKHLLTAAILLGIFAGSACQDYQKGVQESVTELTKPLPLAPCAPLLQLSRFTRRMTGVWNSSSSPVVISTPVQTDKPKIRCSVTYCTEQGGVASTGSTHPKPPLVGRHFYLGQFRCDSRQ